MKKYIAYIIIIGFFSSCYTAKKAQRQIIRANTEFPEQSSLTISKLYPITEKVVTKTEFIKGKTVTKTDTLTIDCDSVVSDKSESNKVKIQYRTIYQTDTILKEKVIEKENTAKTKNLQLQVNRLENTKAKNLNKIKEQKKTISGLWKYLLLSIIANVILVIVIIKR